VSEQTDVAFLRFVSSFGAICGETIQPIAKVFEEVNRNLLPARNTLVVLVQNFIVRPTLPIYAEPERHNAQRYRRSDRRTTS